MGKYYKRSLKPPKNKSFFVFGPRGTGKTTWLRHNFPKAIYVNLLEPAVYNKLLASPEELETFIKKDFSDWVIVDEIQKVPELLNVVHYLIEKNGYKFILTGSNARKLKREGVNLLAGRALVYHMYPLIREEIKDDFVLKTSLHFGNMPAVYVEDNKEEYLESYVMTYLQQEVWQEGWIKNLPAFSRFLKVASFSQGSLLNVSETCCTFVFKVLMISFLISSIATVALSYITLSKAPSAMASEGSKLFKMLFVKRRIPRLDRYNKNNNFNKTKN